MGRYDYEVVGDFKFFKPDPDGIARRPSVLVRLTDEEGRDGWGQSVSIPAWTYETPETVVSTLRDYLAEAIIGADPTDGADIHRRINQAIRPAFLISDVICGNLPLLSLYAVAGLCSTLICPPSKVMTGGCKVEAIKAAPTPPIRLMINESW